MPQVILQGLQILEHLPQHWTRNRRIIHRHVLDTLQSKVSAVQGGWGELLEVRLEQQVTCVFSVARIFSSQMHMYVALHT